MISVKDLTKKFGGFTAVDRISLQIRRGEIFGFLGANGAGKTTAMRMLCGLSVPTSGTGTVAGYDILCQAEEIKRHIGYMSQKFSLYEGLTVWENLNLFATIYGMSARSIREKADAAFKAMGMENMRNVLVREIPLGWKQKLAFMAATLHSPDIVFFDPSTRRKFWEEIYQASSEGMTVFVTTHYLDEAEYCHRVSIMVDGSVKALDSPSGLKRLYHADTMDEVFRVVAKDAKRSD